MIKHSSVMTKDKLIEQFNAVATDTEQLIKSVGAAGGEQAGALRESAEQSIASVRARLRALQDSATDSLESAAHTTDEYVHEHAWKAIGVAAGITLIASVAIGLLLRRR